MNKTFVVLQIVIFQLVGHLLGGGDIVADGKQRQAKTRDTTSQCADILFGLARSGKARQQAGMIRLGDHVPHQLGGQLRLLSVASVDEACQIAAMADAVLTTILCGQDRAGVGSGNFDTWIGHHP